MTSLMSTSVSSLALLKCSIHIGEYSALKLNTVVWWLINCTSGPAVMHLACLIVVGPCGGSCEALPATAHTMMALRQDGAGMEKLQ